MAMPGGPDSDQRRAAASMAGDRPFLELRLLGGFELVAGGERLEVPPASQRVLAFLALHNQLLRRLFVAGSLWPDASDQRACACLRTALWRIRARETELIVSTTWGVRLANDVHVDLNDCQRMARDLADSAASLHNGNVAEFEAELLPDWSDDWLTESRAAWLQLRLHALDSLANARLESRDFARAIEAGLAAVQADPMCESAHRTVIAIHLAEGNAGEAMRHFQALSQLLRSELGIEPSRATRELLLPARLRAEKPQRPE